MEKFYSDLVQFKKEYGDLIVHSRSEGVYAFRYLTASEYVGYLNLFESPISETDGFESFIYKSICSAAFLTSTSKILEEDKEKFGKMVFEKSKIDFKEMYENYTEIENSITILDVFFNRICQAFPSYTLESFYKLGKSKIYKLFILACFASGESPLKVIAQQLKSQGVNVAPRRHPNMPGAQQPGPASSPTGGPSPEDLIHIAKQQLEKDKANPQKTIPWQEYNKELDKFAQSE